MRGSRGHRSADARVASLEAAITSRTRVVLVAHLFGVRVDLGPVAAFAREHGLILVEDCAQAFQGPGHMGNPDADVSMYSFGTLKTSSALGGAVLRVRDREVLSKIRETQALIEGPVVNIQELPSGSSWCPILRKSATHTGYVESNI